ncbi:MAG: M28 family peptidase [Clostridiales bacterium]|nr:M28 family peptidase [Clostridiales bacterium]
MKKGRIVALPMLFLFLWLGVLSRLAQPQELEKASDEKILASLHSISSHKLLDYVRELVSEKYGGRLTGTEGYNASARWVAELLQKWGLRPAGDQGSYLQAFPNPYTLVFPGCEAYLHLPVNGAVVKKHYRFDEEFIPGATSGSGEVTAGVVYVGYGITAPELGYDDYAGLDVKGKIVLMEREVPVSPDDNPELFKKWRPYSFHQYKLENAVGHGAAGMLYNYGPICNPNNSYRQGFIYSHVGDVVVSDIFAGTGRTHKETLEKIRKKLKPQSFITGKTFTLKNETEHYPEGIGYNVIGYLEGSDPRLKEEVIILGGHLDHLGRCYELMPGANDNASAVAVLLGVAEALAQCPVKPPRSVVFLFFGAEEQAVAGSEFYLNNPAFPLEKTTALLNLDGVGCGDKINVLAGNNFPELWAFIEKANAQYVHRVVDPSFFANIARPRLDAARFLWKNVPSLSFSVSGAPSFYHNTKDTIETITPEILEDLAQLLFVAVLDMSDEPVLDFRK